MTPEVTTLIKLESVAETDGAKKFDNQLKQNQRTINSVTKDLKIQEAMLKNKGRSYQYVKAQIAGATQEELKQILALEKNIQKMQENDAAMKNNNKTLRMMRGGFGQVGHQVQDIAVQLQGGTDAMIVFGQQGSQIVSLFGPGGALLGAFLAVGAALITSFKPAVDDSVESLKDIIKQTKEQARELGMLTAAQKEYDQILKQDTLNEATENNEKLNNQLAEQEAKLKRAKHGLAEAETMSRIYNKGVLKSTVETRSFGQAVVDIEKDITKTKSAIADNTLVIDEYTQGTVTAAEKERERLDAIMDIVNAAKEEARTTGMSERELALYQARLQGATIGQLATIDATYKKIEANKAEQKAIDEAEKAEKKRQDTINGVIKAAATQAATVGMNRRELAIYRATLQGASEQEIASLNALHDIIDARQELTKELKAQKDAQKALQEAEEDAFTSGLNKILSRIEDKELAARMAADEEIAIAKEAADRGILNETQYAEAVLAIHQDLHNKLGELRGTSGEGPERTLVDIGTDFDALMEAQKTELDLLQEHQAAKLALIDEHEAAYNDVMVDYAELRKKINEETNAALMAASMTAMSSILSTTQQQVQTLSGFFDQASGIGKAFYAVQQAMAAADAIIQGYVSAANIRTAYAKLAAATSNPGMATAGEMHANMAVAMGFATAAAIAGQTIASFEGGGMTFNGVRSGGMDGRGGRLAMVHPNEKITDLEKTDRTQQPVNVNINIQAVDAKGIDELLVKRRGVITSLVRNSLNNTGARLG